jgi:hypothetical protein
MVRGYPSNQSTPYQSFFVRYHLFVLKWRVHP